MTLLLISDGLIGSILAALIAGCIAVWQTINNNQLAKLNKQLDIKLAQQKLESEHSFIKYDIVTHLLKFSQYQKIYDAVIQMMDKSKVDRFLVFIAINGKTELNNVTCIFQKYKGDKAELDAIAVYRGLKVDDHYLKLLKKMEFNGSVNLNVSKLEPSLIKDIYENEKVTFSRWEFIGRVSIDEKNDVIAYCSASTFSNVGYDNKDLLAIKLHFESDIKPRFIGTIKEMVKN